MSVAPLAKFSPAPAGQEDAAVSACVQAIFSHPFCRHNDPRPTGTVSYCLFCRRYLRKANAALRPEGARVPFPVRQ